eukprot:GHUV01026625.1.p1 GENE.GHUV01026625.1~~GHUV01026625.1.p1  ORF type:complete len:140 (+),score=16.84 GHUV01026625.1:1041-1460(+)
MCLVDVLRHLRLHHIKVTSQRQEVFTQLAVADDLTQCVAISVILQHRYRDTRQVESLAHIKLMLFITDEVMRQCQEVLTQLAITDDLMQCHTSPQCCPATHGSGKDPVRDLSIIWFFFVHLAFLRIPQHASRSALSCKT